MKTKSKFILLAALLTAGIATQAQATEYWVVCNGTWEDGTPWSWEGTSSSASTFQNMQNHCASQGGQSIGLITEIISGN